MVVWEAPLYLASKAQKMAQISGYVRLNVTGLAAAGTVSAQGLKTGDRIIQASSPSLPGNVNIFEAIVSVDDELQQFTAFGSSTAVRVRNSGAAPLILQELKAEAASGQHSGAPAFLMAESTGIEPVRPEGLDALAPRCLAARPTLQFKWRARLDSNQHRAV